MYIPLIRIHKNTSGSSMTAMGQETTLNCSGKFSQGLDGEYQTSMPS
jgi:hypothetical protein